MIPQGTVIGLGIGAVGCTLLPIVALILWKGKTHASVKTFIWGGVCFLFFTQVLEGALHFVCIAGNNAISRAINGSTLLYVVYGCMAAGVFEECGRYIMYKTVLRRSLLRENAVTAGLGHGGVESILVGGTALCLYLATALLINGGKESSAIALAGGQEAFSMVAQQLANMGMGYGLLGFVERGIAMTLHVSLSVVVFYGIQKGKKAYLPLAILLHALFDVPAALYQRGVIQSLPLLELLLLFLVIAQGFFARKLYRDMQDET